MRQVIPVRILEVVDPFHPHRPVHLRFDRERRRVVQEQAARARRLHSPVPPDRRRGQARGQDLLLELLHRDLVVVDRLTPPNDRACLRHHRRDEQRRPDFGRQRIEVPPESRRAPRVRSCRAAVRTGKSPRSLLQPRRRTSAAKDVAHSASRAPLTQWLGPLAQRPTRAYNRKPGKQPARALWSSWAALRLVRTRPALRQFARRDGPGGPLVRSSCPGAGRRSLEAPISGSRPPAT